MANKKKSLMLPACHEDVFRLVRRQQIHTAAELYSLAQDYCMKGDRRLLLYCSGSKGGCKKSLQEIVDAIWKPLGTKPLEGGGSRHTEPLSKEQLAALKRCATSGAKRSSAGSMMCKYNAGVTIMAMAKQGPSIACINDVRCRIDRIAALKAAKNADRAGPAESAANATTPTEKEITLFDHYGRRGEVVIRPRDGVWRLRDFYEVLVGCRKLQGLEGSPLAGVSPLSTLAGGFKIPRSEAGWKAMLAAGVAKPAIPFDKLSPEQRDEAAAEIRFSSVSGSLPWRPPSEAGGGEGDRRGGDTTTRPWEDMWIEMMPDDPKFEDDTLTDTLFEEQLVQLSSHNHVEDFVWVALVRAFQELGHEVQTTSGFKFQRGNMIITGTKARHTTHRGTIVCYGVLCAQASVAEHQMDDERMRLGLPRRNALTVLGYGRSSKNRPQLYSDDQKALAVGPMTLKIKNRATGPAAVEDAPTKASATGGGGGEKENKNDEHMTTQKTKKMRISPMPDEDEDDAKVCRSGEAILGSGCGNSAPKPGDMSGKAATIFVGAELDASGAIPIRGIPIVGAIRGGIP